MSAAQQVEGKLLPPETYANAPAAKSAKMEGKKTIAGEYKTETERSFIMVKVSCLGPTIN